MRRNPQLRTPCEIVPSIPARRAYWAAKSGVAWRCRATAIASYSARKGRVNPRGWPLARVHWARTGQGVQSAAAKATTPSALATALTDLQQAVTLLTPGAGQPTVPGANTGQAQHLLNSISHLLQSVPAGSPFLSAADRDQAVAALAMAQGSFQ